MSGLRLGVDLGGTKIEAVALDSDGRLLLRRRVPTPRHDYGATLDTLVALVQGLEEQLGRRGSVGVGIPGAVSPATGRIKNANSTWLIGRHLKADLSQRLEREVRLANDANCFALSEARDGAGAGQRLVFGVILGTGVGGALVVAGAAWEGRNAIAGEWGHNPLPWPVGSERPGPPCYCGRSGCIETFLSGPSLARDYAQASGRASSPEGIVAAAAAGEPQGRAALKRYCERLARGLAAVVNLLDPDVIVLGGGLSGLAVLYEEVPRLWRPFVFSDRVDTPLLPPLHGAASGVRGAAWLWADDDEPA